MKWTVDQQKAIDGRKGTLLVSAAAGSGKTAVLVERVIRRICDSENPCGVENLLIVTFTNAAAAQMKEKISAAIGKKIALDPTDKRLRRQQMMLPCASICTIDSFCINLVRENFHTLGIAPDFSLLDGDKLSVLRSQAVSAVVDELYANPTENFLQLTELISDTRDDSKLIEAVLRLHELSQAYPFPELWLRSLAENFSNPSPAAESPWGRIIINNAIQLACACIADINHCIKLLADEPELEAKYRPTFEEDCRIFETLLNALSTENWDGIIESVQGIKFPRMATAPKGYESAGKEICKGLRDNYKSRMKTLAKYFIISEQEHGEDIESLSPLVSELISVVLKFSEEFRRLKLEENGADFSDTLHLALKLLIVPIDGGYAKTPLAVALAENYAEILVDEYQDVNEAQDMIFTALSKDESNLFMVGDVKQSIYRFRQAMPEIFLGRRDGLQEYADGNYPAKVTLGKNFRSRSGVTEIVNFIFSALMSRDAGGLEYDKSEYLEAAAAYPESNGADTEICLIEAEKENMRTAQARYAANYIEKAIAEGMTVTDGGVQRPARYKDFCILLRSVKRSAREFVDEFEARGIPFTCETDEDILSAPEIMFMISLLKIIDNPVDDIPLTAAMLSPVFGFTSDDLAVMRTKLRKGSIYHCLVNHAENGDEKSAAFLERLAEMRRIASTVSAGELIRRLIEETGYGAIVGSMKDSQKRKANLHSFIDLAKKYESTGQKGVSGFIRFVDAVSKSGSGMKAGNSESEASDSVKIMTIHKSKGLEFPVCFLAACERKYSTLSLRDDMLIAPQSGIGLKCVENYAKFDTLPRVAAGIEIKKAEHSEELRILYVALTRPKEKLVVLASSSDWNKDLSKIAASIRSERLIDPYTVIGFSSYADCILSTLIRHPDAHALRNAAGIDSSVVLPCKTPLRTEIIREEIEELELGSETETALPNKETVEEIRSRLEYVYPYASLDGIAAKRIASKLNPEEIGGEYFATREPSFVGRDKLTPAQRGTATHRFMQFADYARAGEDFEKELERLISEGMLTETEGKVVDRKSISQFFSGGLAKRILAAEKIYREYTFTASVPLIEMEPELTPGQAHGETVVIQGAVDCAFVENGELVIVDFKTDKASDGSELAEKYRDQLSVYRRCLAEVLDLPVKQTIIYSFRLGECIEITKE